MNRAAGGLWESRSAPSHGAARVRPSDVQWTPSGGLVWREERSGTGVLVVRDSLQTPPRDLALEGSVRARVGYGGGDFSVSGDQVFFVSEGRVFRHRLDEAESVPVTPPWGQAASPSASPGGRRLVYVHSSDGIDCLGLARTDGSGWPVQFASGRDFYMQPAWHPGGRRVAWIAWDHPNMPWDGSGLYLGEIGSGAAAGDGPEPTLVAGDPAGSVAVFQPSFSPDGRYLSFVSDREGWFNLWLYDLEEGSLQALVQDPSEYAGPAWIQGLRTHAWTPSADAVYAIRLSQGQATLVRVDLEERRSQPVGGDLSGYSALSQLSPAPDGERVALVGSSPLLPPRVLTVSPHGVVASWSEVTPEPPEAGYLGHPRPLSWRVRSEVDLPQPLNCQGLFYRPRNPAYRRTAPPPAVIRIHGGPTSQALAEYRFEIPFLTSRGIAVLDLNYRGSSGYGRAYRDALKGQWGVADVEDTRSAAAYLVSSGRADPDRLVVLGGSAGGLTALLCLIRYPGLFRAGVCLYGVSDLLALAQETHKFEAHYLDSLVGVLPGDESLYRDRSPLGRAGSIRDPIALFQGEDDEVVPPSQSDRIAEALVRRGVPHIYHRFPGEGHGWRKSRTIEIYLEALQEFLAQHVV